MKSLVIALAVSAPIALTACLGRQSPAPQFYMLAPAVDRTGQKSDISLAVGPVRVADHLQQSAIVTQTGDYQFASHDFHRWAEPLGKNIAAVTRENLSRLIGTTQVTGYPWLGEAPDYQLAITVDRFNCDPAGRCLLLASWTLTDTKTGKTVQTQRIKLENTAAGTDFNLIVEAMSSLLGDLAKNIAAAFAG